MLYLAQIYESCIVAAIPKIENAILIEQSAYRTGGCMRSRKQTPPELNGDHVDDACSRRPSRADALALAEEAEAEAAEAEAVAAAARARARALRLRREAEAAEAAGRGSEPPRPSGDRRGRPEPRRRHRNKTTRTTAEATDVDDAGRPRTVKEQAGPRSAAGAVRIRIPLADMEGPSRPPIAVLLHRRTARTCRGCMYLDHRQAGRNSSAAPSSTQPLARAS